MSLLVSIDGPMVSTGDWDAQRRLLEQGLGLVPAAPEQPLDAATVAALFGLARTTARTLLLNTPGSAIGVRLVEFAPLSAVTIRPGGVGTACDAMKMLDFFGRDRLATLARLQALGFEPVSEGVEFALPDGSRFVEAHVRAPDGVMVAIIEPRNVPAANFVSVTGRDVSEVQSSSTPVSELAPVRQFYEEVLAAPLGFTYEFQSEAFGQMIGAGEPAHIRAFNYGRCVEDVNLGVIHYGLPADKVKSIKGRGAPPHRGLIGARLTVRDVDALVARCRSAGVAIGAEPATVALAPHGRVRTAAIIAPHGVWHFVTGPAR